MEEKKKKIEIKKDKPKWNKKKKILIFLALSAMAVVLPSLVQRIITYAEIHTWTGNFTLTTNNWYYKTKSYAIVTCKGKTIKLYANEDNNGFTRVNGSNGEKVLTMDDNLLASYIMANYPELNLQAGDSFTWQTDAEVQFGYTGIPGATRKCATVQEAYDANNNNHAWVAQMKKNYLNVRSDFTFPVWADTGPITFAIMDDDEVPKAYCDHYGGDDYRWALKYEPTTKRFSAYKLELKTDPDDGGNVSGQGDYLYNQEVTVVLTSVNEGFIFKGWYNGDTLLSDKESYSFKMPKKNYTITARFDKEQKPKTEYTLSASANPANGGTVEGDIGTVFNGDTVRVEAVPADGYRFAGWTSTWSGFTGKSQSVSFTMPEENVALIANFVKGDPTPTPSPTVGPTISPTPSPIPATPTPTPYPDTNKNYWYSDNYYYSTDAGYNLAGVISSGKLADIRDTQGRDISTVTDYYNSTESFYRETSTSWSDLTNTLKRESYLTGTDSAGNTWYFKIGDNDTATYVHPKYYNGYNVESGGVANITTLIIPETLTYGGKTYTVIHIGGYSSYHRTGMYNYSYDVFNDQGYKSMEQQVYSFSPYYVSYNFFNNTNMQSKKPVQTQRSAYGYFGIMGTGKITSEGEFREDYIETGGSKEYSNETNHYIYNTTLTGIIIPDTVTRIDSYAFMYCQALTEIVGGEGLISIGTGAFMGASTLEAECTESYTESEWVEIYRYFYNKEAYVNEYSKPAKVAAWEEAVKLPSLLHVPTFSVLQTIESSAFAYHKYQIDEMMLPATITSIGTLAFDNCYLDTLVIPTTNVTVGDDRGTLGTKGTTAPKTVIATFSGSGAATYGKKYNTHYDLVYLHSVTYHPNGGAGADYTQVAEQVTGESKPYKLTILDNQLIGFTRSGYHLAGTAYTSGNSNEYTPIIWNTRPNGTGDVYNSGDTVLLDEYESIDVYAQWIPNIYTVTFDWNFDWNGTGVNPQKHCSTETITVTYDSTYGAKAENGNLPVPERDGYTFLGWCTEESGGNGSGTVVTSSSYVKIANHHTLYAKWEPNKYLIGFDFNFEIYRDAVNFDYGVGNITNWYDDAHTLIEVTYDSPYGVLPRPTRLNYRFGGWVLKEDKYGNGTGTEIVSADTILHIENPSNHTLYAKWEPKSPTLHFDTAGGDPLSDTVVYYEMTYGDNDTYPGILPTPVYLGHEFLGWYTEPNGGGTEVTAATVVDTLADHTIYASWVGVECIVDFDTQGGTPVSSKTVRAGREYGVFETTLKTGYTFDAWYYMNGGVVTTVVPTTIVTTSGDHTLTAAWIPNKYTVVFDWNFNWNATGVNTKTNYSGDTKEVTYHDTYETLPAPSRDGYTFKNWLLDGAVVTNTTTVSTPNNHKLVAKWEVNQYTISFNSMGGNACDSISATYDSTYGTLPTPTKDGYTFAGWSTKADNTGIIITETSAMKTPENHTLYAQWIPKSCKVTFEWNFNWNATGVKTDKHYTGDTMTVTYDAEYKTLPKPEREGYQFVGWFTGVTDGNGSGTVISDNTIVKTENDHTLYAKWEPYQYKVNLDYEDEYDAGNEP